MRRAPLVLIVLLVAACSHDGHDAAGDGLEKPAAEAVAGICSAVSASDPAAAKTAFQSVHDELHDLGDALTEHDREAAARFLRAKSTVESDISRNTAQEQLQASLTGLFQAIATAVDVLDVPASVKC